jgi:hypothetical protein
MYRRGTFVASNALPIVTVTGPTNDQAYSAPANVLIEAAAKSPDGTISLVEFYQGSTKLGQTLSAPYSLTWSNVPAGTYNLYARAIDNLGGTTDSSPVTISVGQQLKLTGAATLSGGVFQFTLSGNPGLAYRIQQSTNLMDWITLKTITNASGAVSFQDPGPSQQPHRFYRAMLLQ